MRTTHLHGHVIVESPRVGTGNITINGHQVQQWQKVLVQRLDQDQTTGNCSTRRYRFNLNPLRKNLNKVLGNYERTVNVARRYSPEQLNAFEIRYGFHPTRHTVPNESHKRSLYDPASLESQKAVPCSCKSSTCRPRVCSVVVQSTEGPRRNISPHQY